MDSMFLSTQTLDAINDISGEIIGYGREKRMQYIVNLSKEDEVIKFEIVFKENGYIVFEGTIYENNYIYALENVVEEEED